MNNLCDENGRPMRHEAIYAALGLNPKRHLPEEGLYSRHIGNVVVWVTPKEKKVRQDGARTRCFCPFCFREMPTGKLHQHMKMHR